MPTLLRGLARFSLYLFVQFTARVIFGNIAIFSTIPIFRNKLTLDNKSRAGNKPNHRYKLRAGNKPNHGNKPSTCNKPNFGSKPFFCQTCISISFGIVYYKLCCKLTVVIVCVCFSVAIEVRQFAHV